MPENKTGPSMTELNRPKEQTCESLTLFPRQRSSALLKSSPACLSYIHWRNAHEEDKYTWPEMCMEITEAERINMPKKKMVKHAGK